MRLFGIRLLDWCCASNGCGRCCRDFEERGSRRFGRNDAGVNVEEDCAELNYGPRVIGGVGKSLFEVGKGGMRPRLLEI